MGSKLQITLFGMPNFHLPSMPDLQISSRKAIALLVFLVTTGKEHSRESLAEMLWEGRSQTQCMANLRVLLTRLRHSMGDYLIITRESVAFNLDRETWIDVKLFEEHLAAAERIEFEIWVPLHQSERRNPASNKYLSILISRGVLRPQQPGI